MYIITEFMKHGSLHNYLRGEGHSLKFPTLVKMANDVASGMAYLERKGYIHADLAARNILVGDNLISKVGSFGNVITPNEYKVPEGFKFPIRWTPHDAAVSKCISIKSSVWAFGIVVYELVTHGSLHITVANAHGVALS